MIEKSESGLIGLISYPIDVLGPGRRLGIWFQGCHQDCSGCISPHSRSFDESTRLSLAEVQKKLAFFQLLTDRLTISGGEPLAQPDFLRKVLISARERGFVDILVYTGLYLEEIRRNSADLLDLIDVLIDGPYDRTAPTQLIWRGSANQTMHLLSTHQEILERYRPFVDLNEEKPAVQIVPCHDKTVLVGIPRGGGYLPPDAGER